jgi:hypothetical protein
MKAWRLAGALALAFPAFGDWVFGPDLTLGEAPRAGLFHQLEGTARQHLAVDGDGAVAVTWADNAGGTYQVRVAFRAVDDSAFGTPQPLSTGSEAYQPVVVATSTGFLFAWEQDGHVWMRSGSPAGLGPAVRIDEAQSTEPALAAHSKHGIVAAWARRESGVMRIVSATVTPGEDGAPHIGEVMPVDVEAAVRDQLYPTVAVTDAGVLVGWEDRRHGHTRLYTAFRAHDGAFSAPRLLNDLPSGPRSVEFGAGSGVTRLALATRGNQVGAVWLDKRDYRSGYDVFAAISDDGGQNFGPNEMVPDMFGANTPQWRAAIAMDPEGLPLAIWDDTRDDTPDLWMSWREDGEWSDDQAVAPGYGPGAHTSASVAFGPDGRLHLLWTSSTPEGWSHLRYTSAERR